MSLTHVESLYDCVLGSSYQPFSFSAMSSPPPGEAPAVESAVAKRTSGCSCQGIHAFDLGITV